MAILIFPPGRSFPGKSEKTWQYRSFRDAETVRRGQKIHGEINLSARQKLSGRVRKYMAILSFPPGRNFPVKSEYAWQYRSFRDAATFRNDQNIHGEIDLSAMQKLSGQIRKNVAILSFPRGRSFPGKSEDARQY